MKITRIYLKGYKPFALCKIDELDITVAEIFTLILGTNGSGKSSLLREANPLPASSSDYTENGEKRIYLEHNGSVYELISILGRTGKHTFIKDGVVIHANVTATQQRELVIKEFNYSPVVHRLLIGDLKFTSMSPSQRRDVLTLISPLDLRYGLKLHSDFKEGLRDNQAILKHLVAKGSDAKAKLRELNIPEDADEKRAEIEAQLNLLIPFTQTKLPSIHTVMDDIDTGYAKLNQIKQRLDRFDNTRIPDSRIKSLDDLNDYIADCSGKIVATQMNVNNLTAEVESLTGVTNSIIDNSLSVDDLQIRIAAIEQELNAITDTCFVNSNHEMYLATLKDLASSFDIIADNSRESHIPTVDERNEALRVNKELELRRNNILNRIEFCKKEIQHFSDSSTVTACPKCKFEFDIHGTTAQDKIAEFKASITKCEELLPKVERDLKINQDLVQAIYQFDRLANEIHSIKRSLPMPYEFWEMLGSDENILLYPSKVANTIIKWTVNLENGKRKRDLQEELASYTKALDIFVKYGNGVDNKLTLLQESIVTELRNKRMLERQLTTAKTLLRNIQLYTDLSSQGDALLQELSYKFKLATEIAIQNDAKQNCEQLYGQLADSKQLLNQRNNLLVNIKEMEEEYVDLASNQKCLALLEEHISPTKGLIADQMLGFINSYLAEINNICNELWEYALTVCICNMDNGVLDYTFPLLVDDEPIPDISNGSTGQVDVVNLAFTIVMRQYLGLMDYPIYLDETGASFDELHRSKLMQYIKALHCNGLSSQIFMVNHYAAQYGGLANHDVVVLDARNITVPDKYNQHTTITYRN